MRHELFFFILLKCINVLEINVNFGTVNSWECGDISGYFFCFSGRVVHAFYYFLRLNNIILSRFRTGRTVFTRLCIVDTWEEKKYEPKKKKLLLFSFYTDNAIFLSELNRGYFLQIFQNLFQLLVGRSQCIVVDKHGRIGNCKYYIIPAR